MRKMVGVLILLFSICQAGLASTNFFDPTRPQTHEDQKKKSKALDPSRFQLSFVVFGPDRKLAIINGVTVRIGDYFKRYRVEEIRPQSVVLQDQGEQWIVYMNQTIKQQLSST